MVSYIEFPSQKWNIALEKQKFYAEYTHFTN